MLVARCWWPSPLRVLDLQTLHAVDPPGPQPLRLSEFRDVRRDIGDRVEHDVDFHPGEIRTDAVVRPHATETQVRVRVTGDVEFERTIEDILVVVRGAVEQADPLPFLDLHTTDLGVV